MSLWFSYLGLAAVWVGFFSLLFSSSFLVQTKKSITSSLSYTMIVASRFTLVYYFLCLLKKKAPLFMWNDNKEVYNFFDSIPGDLYSWMHGYYRITLLCIGSCAFVFLMVLAKFVAEHFFSP